MRRLLIGTAGAVIALGAAACGGSKGSLLATANTSTTTTAVTAAKAPVSSVQTPVTSTTAASTTTRSSVTTTSAKAATVPTTIQGFGDLTGDWYLEFVDVSPAGSAKLNVFVADRVTVTPALQVVAATEARVTNAPSCAALPAGSPLFTISPGLPGSRLAVNGGAPTIAAGTCAKSDQLQWISSTADLWGSEQVITLFNNSLGWRLRRTTTPPDLAGNWLGQMQPGQIVGASGQVTGGSLAERGQIGEPYVVKHDGAGFSVSLLETGKPSANAGRCTVPPGTVVMTFAPDPSGKADTYAAKVLAFDFTTCTVVRSVDTTLVYGRTLGKMWPSLHTAATSGAGPLVALDR